MPVLDGAEPPYRKSCRGINGRGPSEAGEVPVYAAGVPYETHEIKFDPGASLKGSDGGKSLLVDVPFFVRRRPKAYKRKESNQEKKWRRSRIPFGTII